MESSLVSGVGAIATSSNARTAPPVCLGPRRDQRLPPVGEHEHVARLDVRCGMLDQAEVVAGRVVEAKARHNRSVGAGTRP